ncbi:GntR family transcriptional regulator [Sporosarcina sp. G11-34]|uniref:GntR family transcriptional regulator n=1 Tax=Sporosarcina sp. G11-34 TaxID=2849605 RepID=UPI0022A91054|nr:GntR family transcriptional regulator [Sporosarcina sp. G11-34]MCZ2258611.1 GntR family transcriptional regulator [Sporosarcina sp. G11-34]
MKKVKPAASLAEQAYSSIKTAIMSGKLASEIELPEERLATDLGVSRTPFREAIRRLAAEGLVVLNKGKPATVATFTKEDSLDFMELRSVLEIYNIRKVVSMDDPIFIHALEENLKRQEDAIKEDDYEEFIDYDRAFHLILASKNENSKIREMIHQMNSGVNRAFLMLSNTVHMSAMGAYEEHERILEAIKLKDIELATKEMTIHLENIEERFLFYYKKRNE